MQAGRVWTEERRPGEGARHWHFGFAPRDLPVGSFIMPADSTDELGASNLEQMAQRVPAKHSNGEFEVTPTQVHAIGAAAYRDGGVVDGVAPGSFGLMRKGRRALADGGLVDDEEQRRRDAVAAAVAPPPPAPASAAPAAAAPPAAAPLDGGAGFGKYPFQRMFNNTRAQDDAMRRGVQATAPGGTVLPAPTAPQPLEAPPAPAVQRLNAATDPRSTAYVDPAAPPAPAAAAMELLAHARRRQFLDTPRKA